jgi:hypothetical protein
MIEWKALIVPCEMRKVTPDWRDLRVRMREFAILNGAAVLEELPKFMGEELRWQS